MYHAGRDHMKNGTKSDEYYISSTLHLLGTIFAYHEIYLTHGIYSQINDSFGGFGNDLQKRLDDFGTSLVVQNTYHR
jgi:hypothetical protein